MNSKTKILLKSASAGLSVALSVLPVAAQNLPPKTFGFVESDAARDMFNSKFFRDSFGAFAMSAGDRNDFRAHAIAKAWDLRGPGKPGADNTDADRCFLHLENLIGEL